MAGLIDLIESPDEPIELSKHSILTTGKCKTGKLGAVKQSYQIIFTLLRFPLE
jgi:hypothetical protein